MQNLVSRLNHTKLIPIASSLPTTIDAGNVNMAYGQNNPINCHPDFIPYIREIEGLTGRMAVSIMVNTLNPGSESPIHTDPGVVVRYHYPIITNQHACWWDEIDGSVYMACGYWYGPVLYTRKHAVYNRGTTPRIHLIVDLEN